MDAVAAVESVGWRRRFPAQLFLLDWAPFVLLVVLYEALRDLVPVFGAPHHYLGWIDSDLFGGRLPTIWLQSNFYRAQSVDWEDSAATAVYFLYYLVPLVVGLFWWFRKRSTYFRYASALLTLCGLAFATYIVLPTVPPWLAFPQSVHEITDATVRGWNLPGQLVSVYLDHDYNLYAAFPSLHAAFPVVMIYYGWLRSRVLGAVMMLYAALVWISIVFLGEHYVIDIVGAIAYAIVAIIVVESFARWRAERSRPHP